MSAEDYWVDQYGPVADYCLGNKQWQRAHRFTDWASEFLSGPVREEDLLAHKAGIYMLR